MTTSREECRVCLGDGELMISGETGAEQVARRRRLRQQIRGLYATCWRALHLARHYTEEVGAVADLRVEGILDAVYLHRATIAFLREGLAAVGRRPEAYERLAWCIACRGTGLADIECQGCGAPVAADTVNERALVHADVLVHPTCDTGHAWFDDHPAQRRAS